MSEYIDKESLLERIKDLDTWSECKYGGFTLREYPFGMFDCDDVVNTIESSPAADVAPVVHGRWIPFHSEAAGGIQYCAVCKIGNAAKSDFCPHCGAMMDGGIDDEAD